MLVRERVSAEESALTDHPRSATSAFCPRRPAARRLARTPPCSSCFLSPSFSLLHVPVRSPVPTLPFRRAVLSKQRERLCPLVPAVKPGRILNSRHFIAFAIYRRAARPKDVVLSFARFISFFAGFLSSGCGDKNARAVAKRCHTPPFVRRREPA